jgi:predicted ester cyclase
MSIAENKVLAYRMLDEIFSQGDLSRADELFSPEIVVHDPDKELSGRDQVKQGLMRLRTAFPDLRYTVEDTIAEGDKVVIRFTGRGTQRGEFRGVPPTDRHMST